MRSKIIWTIIRWVVIAMWIILIWIGFEFAIQIVCTALLLSLEIIIIGDNLKDKKSIWG